MSRGDWSDIERAELERRHREACGLLLAVEEELARLAIALERAHRNAESVHADLAVARDDIAHLVSEVALRDEMLAGVLDSASWQVTRPLRSLKALLRESDP